MNKTRLFQALLAWAVVVALTPNSTLAYGKGHENHGNKHEDRDDDRNHGQHDQDDDRNRPPGWSHGKKTGWGDCDLPPGQAKKHGCHDRDDNRHHHDRDHDADDRHHDRDHDRDHDRHYVRSTTHTPVHANPPVHRAPVTTRTQRVTQPAVHSGTSSKTNTFKKIPGGSGVDNSTKFVKK